LATATDPTTLELAVLARSMPTREKAMSAFRKFIVWDVFIGDLPFYKINLVIQASVFNHLPPFFVIFETQGQYFCLARRF
jgi:hypothetical protein